MDTTATYEPLGPAPVGGSVEVSFSCPVCRGRIHASAHAQTTEMPCPHCGALIATPSLSIGAGMELDDFRLIQRIGRGSMGEVYLADQLSLSRRVAVKILAPGLTSSPDQVRRFRAEIHGLARLQHPNIVSAFYAGACGDVHYLAMTYVDGENLHAYSERRGPLPEDEALSVVYNVALALRYAWEEHGFIHRDIKPANIMIDGNGQVKLTDLGISKFVYEETSATYGHRIFGTPHYMSPEQARGELDLDFRSDMYSLGATLYHLLAGHPPFDGLEVDQIIHCQIRERPTPVRWIRPDLSDACGALLDRLLSKHAGDRFDSWDALLHAVTEALENLPTRYPAARAYDTQTVWLDRTYRRKRFISRLAIISLLLLLIGGSLWIWNARVHWRLNRSPPGLEALISGGDGRSGLDLRTPLATGWAHLETLYRRMYLNRAERVRQQRVREVLDHLDRQARAYLLQGLPDHAAAVYIDYNGPWAEESRKQRLERAEIYARRGLAGPPLPETFTPRD